MNVKITDGKLTLDLQELVDELGEKDRAALARQLVADELLFAAVLECVVKGEYFTDDPAGPWWFDRRRVLELREQLLPLMRGIAREGVTEALRQRNEAQASERRTGDWAWKLFHAWPVHELRFRPHLPDGWTPAPPPTSTEVDELVGSAEISVEAAPP